MLQEQVFPNVEKKKRGAGGVAGGWHILWSRCVSVALPESQPVPARLIFTLQIFTQPSDGCGVVGSVNLIPEKGISEQNMHIIYD